MFKIAWNGGKKLKRTMFHSQLANVHDPARIRYSSRTVSSNSTISKDEMETTIAPYYRCILKVAGFREKGLDFQAAVRLVTIR